MVVVPEIDPPPFTAHEVYPRMWQGSAPPIGNFVRGRGFTHLALCAMEYQVGPPEEAFPGVTVFYAPNDDAFDGIGWALAKGVVETARKVATAVHAGGRVLVTCREGKNRSGIVSALAIVMLTGNPGFECAKIVQESRPRALRNPAFLDMLGGIPAHPELLRAFPV